MPAQVGPEVLDVLDADREPHQPLGDGRPARTSSGGGARTTTPRRRGWWRAPTDRRGAHQQVRLVGGGQHDRDHRAEAGVADLGEERMVARRRASSAAFDCARSTRRCSVRRPRSASQASNGPGVLPCTSRRPLSTSCRSSSRVTIAPSWTSLWPARYLVAECTTTSAPRSSRPLQQRGEERVVDDHAGAGLVRRGDDRGGVGHLEGRVGRRLEPDQRGVLARRDHGRGVREVDEGRGQPAAQLEVGERDQRAVVGVPRARPPCRPARPGRGGW